MQDEPEVLYPDPGLWTKTSLIQLFYGIMVNLTSVTFGIAFSFSSVMMPQLSKVDPKITTTMTEETLIGRLIVGLGCGMGMIPPRAYVTEISLPNMRGVNGSFPSVGIALGVILQESKSSINPDAGNIALGFARLIVGIGTSFLMLKVGRRFLALVSSLGVFGAFLLFGIFIIYNTQPSAIPFVFFFAYIAFSSIGYYPLPMLLIFELSPLQIRGIVGGLGIATLNGTTFAVNAFYLPVRSLIGFANVILAFSILSLLGTFYVYFYLPETKDLTLQEIEEFYNERRPTLTSQRRIRSMQALSRQLGSAESRSLMRIKSKSFAR
ncbi:Facilitated trehalose transporter Tret1 [Papilio xuthus]|uniref:Facilitated trehalose transporter Tret1 n=1 Tax=Papilio xuthus TaxID=66420 RepID=A0A194Q9C3_PAPXU|nr:Facilitated trehalose transporter Tret1 [Papilio xuthus]